MIVSEKYREPRAPAAWGRGQVLALTAAAVVLGLGLGYLVPLLAAQTAVLALVGAGLGALSLVLIRPQLGFVLLALGASFVTSVALPIGNLGPGEVVVLLLLGVALMGLATRVYQFTFLALYIPMGLYLILGLLSLTYSAHPSSGVPKIIQWLDFIAVVLVTVTLRPSDRIVKAAVGVFLLVQAGLGCFAVVTAFDSGISEAGLYILDFHKNALGLYMAMGLPILLARFLWPLATGARRSTLLLLAPVAAGLILSGSRGSWFGALLGCTVLAFYRSLRAGLTAVLVLAAVVLIGNAVLPESLTRADEIIAGTGSVEGRIVAWTEALQTYSEHPLGGVGIGSYVSDSRYHGAQGDYNVTDPHNILIRLLVELGPLGLGFFLAIWALIGRQGLQNNRTLRTPPLLALNAGLIAALASYIGTGMFGPAFQRGHGTLFFFFAALLFVLPWLQQTEDGAQRAAAGQPSDALLLPEGGRLTADG